MAKSDWGRHYVDVNTDEFKKFTKGLRNLVNNNGEHVLVGFRLYVNDGKKILKEVTPVRTGNLKKHWKEPVYYKTGNNLSAVVENDAEYSVAVNDGHRQNPGQYVPVDGGFTLINDYVPGMYFVETGIDVINNTSVNSSVVSNIVKYIVKKLD